MKISRAFMAATMGVALTLGSVTAASAVTVDSSTPARDLTASSLQEGLRLPVAGSFSRPTPTISGVAAVNSKLTAKPGTIKPTPTAISYQWMRNGKSISGAKASTYTPVAADLGARLSVRINVAKSGYTTSSKTSGLTKAVTPKIRFSGDGIFKVGTKVVAGTYKTLGTSNGCYWSRTRDSAGDSIIANYFGDGQSYVTVKATDPYLELSNCGAWFTAPTSGTPVSTIKASGGTFAVGIDIKAGTYVAKNTAGTYCDWDRLTGASGESADRISSDFIKGQAYVTIASTDKYFFSDGCGVWTTAPTTGPNATSLGNVNGMFAVGVDLKPGTYKAVNTAGTYCSWERLSNATGLYTSQLGYIRANGQSYVTIAAGDKYFTTDSCGAWKPAPTTGPKAKTINAAGGTFAVGIDIAAGTYKAVNTAGTTCTWNRMTNASGASPSNGSGSRPGQSYVTISTADKYFLTGGCGVWTVAPTTGTPKAKIPSTGGVFAVGIDILPGTYTSNPQASGCSWERLNSASGATGTVIKSGYGSVGVKQTVAILASDKYFETSKCGSWTRTGN